MDLEKVLENVQTWAREVGRMQIEKSEDTIKFNTKSTKIDMVTEVDILSEKMILERIRETYPQHSILSEEKGYIENKGEYTWVVDPIDGTTNYLHGFPMFSISIALKHFKEAVLGVVYIPRLNEMFTAVKGKGAFLNGKSISVSDANSFRSSIVATGFPYDKAVSDVNNIDLFNHIIKDVQGMRRTGSASCDLCYIACGRLDGYWELKLSQWDVAAGEFIVREAGGRTHIIDAQKLNGEIGLNIIAGNPVMTDLLYKKFNEVEKYFD